MRDNDFLWRGVRGLAIGVFLGMVFNAVFVFGDEPPCPRIPADVLVSLASCPCPAGPCICGDACDCKDCPEHKTWKPGEPTGIGSECVYFGADWCGPCGPAQERITSLKSQIYKVDCTAYENLEHPLARKYGVTLIPCCLYLVDGKVKSRCVGEHVGKTIVGGWLNALEKPAAVESSALAGRRVDPVSRPAASISSLFYAPGRSSWTWPGDLRQHMAAEHGYSLSSLNGMSDQSVISLHEQLHSGRRTQTVRYAPAYQPRTYFRQQSYCPSCAR